MKKMPQEIWIRMILMLIIFVAGGYLFFRTGCEYRKTYITVKYEDVQKDVYDSLKEAGVNLTPDQKQVFERAVKQNHKAVGFK